MRHKHQTDITWYWIKWTFFLFFAPLTIKGALGKFFFFFFKIRCLNGYLNMAPGHVHEAPSLWILELKFLVILELISWLVFYALFLWEAV